MTLDEIVLHDFGVYAGKNTICLSPVKEKPVVLFGGLNGAGKTTILDALQLCLFGAAAQCAGRDGGYQDYLSQTINRRSLYKQASVSLVFRRFAEGKEARYRVTRAWRKSSGGIKESLDVTVDKISAPTIARNWEEHVNQIMPANIAHLFFFDGEKAASYASPESARNLVETGIYSLLGMDVVEQANRDLKVLERRRRAKELPQIDRETIAAKEAEIHSIEKRMTVLTEQRAGIQSRTIDTGNSKLAELKKSYDKLGGGLRDRKEKIERRRQRVKNVQNSIKTRMFLLAEGQMPLLMVSEMLLWMDERQQQEDDSLLGKLMVDTLATRDRDMLRELPKTESGQQISAILKKFSSADIAKRRSATQTEILLNMDKATTGTVSELAARGLPRLTAELDKTISQWQKWEARMNSAEEEFYSIPENDVFADNIRAQSKLETEIEHAEREMETLGREYARLNDQCAKLQSDIEGIEKANAHAETAHQDVQRFVEHSVNARKIMDDFKHQVIRRHISRIEMLVLESYQMLLRKQSLVSGLKIDPDTFDITLYGLENAPLSAGELSKGEQQLLAIALLWGMARASGKALPVAIDTPLGRLDSSHRTHLVERYFGHASHQVLLFSTDEEISGDYRRKLQPYIGRSYLLSHDDKTGSSSVAEGTLDKPS